MKQVIPFMLAAMLSSCGYAVAEDLSLTSELEKTVLKYKYAEDIPDLKCYQPTIDMPEEIWLIRRHNLSKRPPLRGTLKSEVTFVLNQKRMVMLHYGDLTHLQHETLKRWAHPYEVRCGVPPYINQCHCGK